IHVSVNIAQPSKISSICVLLAPSGLLRFCTALVILQGSTRSLDTAVTDKPDQVLFCFQGHKCIPCPENWIQYGENCYHFSKEWKTWQESKAQCSALEFIFLISTTALAARSRRHCLYSLMKPGVSRLLSFASLLFQIIGRYE
uniref:C-type lectin domain-containing protein n=1 Tax=Strix occidentalis caurina TaxID=311401 RepID=A0A8D0FEW2_STROC